VAVAHARAEGVAWRVRLREPALRGAELLAVSGFALAQPLFDILGKNAEFFAVRGSTPFDIVVFALAVVFVPPLALLVVELAVGAVSRVAGLALHLVFLGFLGAAFGIQAFKRLGVDGTASLISLAVLTGAAIALLAWRARPARAFLHVLAAAPVVFLLLFLFNTPVEQLVLPGNTHSATAAVRSSTPIVFLLFDEFPVIDLQGRDGEIDAGRFPNFARLAHGSTWLRNTTTLSASTTVAVPVILTGNPPKKGALPISADYPNNLFTLLRRRYRMAVIESQTHLCPASVCKRKNGDTAARLSSLYSDVRTVYLHLVAPPALEQRLPAIDESWGNFGSGSAAAVPAAPTTNAKRERPKVDLSKIYLSRLPDFRRFLASFRPPGNGRPTLYFLHVLLPHTPWLFFPDGRVRAVTKRNAPGRYGEYWFNGELAVQAWQRHLLQLGFTDRLLGRFMTRLQRTGLWDRSLVIVTADHGISFRGGDLRRRPTKTNLAELAFTPLFVKLPGQTKGRIVDHHVTTPDILPTIADVLGVRIPWKTGGRSALRNGAESKVVKVFKVSAPYRVALAQRQRSLARQLGLFGSGTWGPELAGTGPYRGLVGAAVKTLRVSPGSGSATVDALGSKLVRAFPRGSPSVPSPLAGTLSGVPLRAHVALALNGRIQAVSVDYRNPQGGPVRFSELAGETAFRPGRNSVQLFVVTGPASAPALRELQVRLS
jgi:hypothetical protein